MKKKLGIILLLVLILGFFTAYVIISNNKDSEQQPTSTDDLEDSQMKDVTWPCIYIEDVAASEKDAEAVVNVHVLNNPGIAGALIRFRFDERLELKEVHQGEAFSTLDYTPPGIFNSPCNFNWDSESGEASTNGIILTMTFALPDELNIGEEFEISCSFRDGDIYDENLDNVSIETHAGKIEIK